MLNLRLIRTILYEFVDVFCIFMCIVTIIRWFHEYIEPLIIKR